MAIWMFRAAPRLAPLVIIWCYIILFTSGQVTISSLQVAKHLAPYASSIKPFFSWTINSTFEYGVSQTSYQISVSHSDGEEIWNSGVTSSSRTQLIQYTGPQLLPHIPYTWSVNISTSAGSAVASSELLADSLNYDVLAGKRDEPLPSELDKHFESFSSWIWTADGSLDDAPPGNRVFRYTFDVPSGETALSALIMLTVDDRFSLYINGNQVDTHSGWPQGQQYDIRFTPDTTRIVFAINGTNSRGRAGVITAIQVILSSGESHFLQSDDSWRSIVTIPDGFQSPNFNDASWPNATVLGPFGIEPWAGNITFSPPKVLSVGVVPTLNPLPPTVISSFSASAPSMTPSAAASANSNQNIGAIMGGAIGGVILVLIILVVYLRYRRKTRKHTDIEPVQPYNPFNLKYEGGSTIHSVSQDELPPVFSLQRPQSVGVFPSMPVSATADRNSGNGGVVQRIDGNPDVDMTRMRLQIMGEQLLALDREIGSRNGDGLEVARLLVRAAELRERDDSDSNTLVSRVGSQPMDLGAARRTSGAR